MIIQQNGYLKDNLYMLGHPEAPIFLVDAPEPAIFDAGVTVFGPTYVQDIRKILGGRQPRRLFLTHSHYDHCGSAAQLKCAFPDLKVIASPIAAKNFKRPRVIETITNLNGFLSSALDPAQPEAGRIAFAPFEVDIPAMEGDTIALSADLAVQVIETPGHTRDCLSYFIAGPGILFAGESLGIADQTGYIYSEWLYDYDDYVQSIHKLRRLKPGTICLGHYKVFTGEDAKTFPDKALRQTEAFFDLIRQCLEAENGDLQKTMAQVKKAEYDPKPEPKQPEPAYLLNLTAKIAAVKKKLAHPK